MGLRVYGKTPLRDGRTGLTHVLIGSVTEKVVRLAPCPVLVTRGTTEAADA